ADAPARTFSRRPSTARERRAAEAGVLVVMVLWAANFIVVKSAIGVIPPIAFAFIRFAAASVTLLILLKWREGSIGLPRRDILPIAALGALGFGIYQSLWPTALQTISAGDSALIIASTPVLTALFAVVARSDVLTPGKLLGAIVSFAGVAVVIAGAQRLDLAASIGGDLLTLAAAVCWALYSAFGAPVLRRHSPLRTTTWAIIFGTICLTIPGILQIQTIDTSRVGAATIGAVLYSAFLSAGVSNVVVFHGIWLLGPTRVTAFQFLVPAIAVVLAAIFLGDAIRPAQIIGGAIIVLGVVVTRSGSSFAGRVRRAGVSSRP
ncbi:MAG TPA: DMT family transporter, partial [Candidatus Limnocylindrales bacterium]